MVSSGAVNNGRRHVVLLARFFDAFIRKGVIKSFGVLVPAMSTYFGASYATIGLILSLNAALMQLMCLCVNPLMKRVSIRRVATVGGLSSSICIIFTAFSQSVFLSGFLFMCAGVCFSASNLGTTSMLHQHFGATFGSVNSLGLMGISAGSTLIPLLTAKLFQGYGLHGTLLILGGLLLNEIPIGAVLVPPRQEKHRSYSLLPHEEQFGSNSEQHIDGSDSEKVNDCKTNSNIETASAVTSTGIGRTNNERCVSKDDVIEMVGLDEGGQATTFDNNDLLPGNESLSICRTCWRILTDTFDFRIFRVEKHFTIFMIPILITTSLANYGWVLFVISYAISVGIDPFKATYLAAVGAAGGIAACVILFFIFHKRPHWSPQLMAILTLCGALTLLLQPLSSSLLHLLVCSFFIGGGLYGTATVIDAVVAIIVAPEHFQGTIAFTLALEGIGTLIAGPFSGFLFDYTGSFETVFRVLGGLNLVAHVFAVLLVVTRWCSRPVA